QWDIKGLENALNEEFGSDMKIQYWLDKEDDLNEDGLRRRILDTLVEDYHAKELLAGEEGIRNYEKYVLLNVLDRIWKEHLAAMDYLRQSIGLRGYAQKNPKQEYKRESFEMFSEMLDKIKHEAISILSKVKIQAHDEVENIEERGHAQTENINYQHDQVDGMHQDQPSESEASAEQPFVRGERKVGRNEPCWCGSGKKFKQCHGKLT
ncbi:MAG: SEC-C domain-containing protein, partial [Gammaproteobacteria bacterium]|nr:SEC-C domain-containing protein [Gammaproteobacteria bacterium]